jgi:diguanylate cyclase (GGDEF)-like protein/PAS domain S-box-containing protein
MPICTGRYNESEYWKAINQSIIPMVQMLLIYGIVIQFIFMIEDWFVAQEHFSKLFTAKAISIAILISMHFFSKTKIGKKYNELNILIVSICLVVVVSFQATLLDQAFMMPLLAIILTFSSSTLIPWKLRYHILLTIIVVIGVLVNMIMINDAPYIPLEREALHGIVFSFSSILLAMLFHKRRIGQWCTEQVLKENEERFRQLAENSSEIIWVWSSQNNITFVSSAYKHFTGRDTQSLYNNPNEIFEIIHSSYRKKFKKALHNIEQGKIQKIDLKICHIDGTMYSLEAWGAPIKDDQGNIIRYIGGWRDITDRVQLINDLNVMATTDHLTKAYNRHLFFEIAQKTTKNALRKQTSFTLILFDIDNFKNLNDTYGHQMGDKVLVEISNLCMEMFRGEDIFARFGGEEFIVLLPDTDNKDAMPIANRIRDNISKHLFDLDDKTVHVTVSVGISSWSISEIESDINILIKEADQAMYHSKTNGRDQVTSYQNI